MLEYINFALDVFIWGFVCAAGIAVSYLISEELIKFLNKLRKRLHK